MVNAAFSSDGKVLATGAGNTLRLWNARDGRLLHQIRGYENYGGAIAFSPDGQWLASMRRALQEHEICLWDFVTGKAIRRFPANGGVFAISPDAKLLAIAAKNGSILVRDAAASNEVYHFSENKQPPVLVRFTPDGGSLLALTEDKQLYRWSLAKGKLEKVINLTVSDWQNVALSPDCKTLALNPNTGPAGEVWDLDAGTMKFSLVSDGVFGRLALAFSPDGKKLACEWRDLKKDKAGIWVWDTSTGKILSRFPTTFLRLNGLCFAPDNRTVVAFPEGSGIKVFDTSTGKSLFDFPAHVHTVWSLSFTGNGKQLVSAAESIRLWEAATGRHIRGLASPEETFFNRAIVLPNSQKILSVGNGMMFVQDLEKPEEIRRILIDKKISKDSQDNFYFLSMAVRPDMKSVAFYGFVPNSHEARLQIWDLDKGEPLVSRPDNFPRKDIPCFSPDAALLLHRSENEEVPRAPGQPRPPEEEWASQIVIQDVATGETVLTLKQRDRYRLPVAFTSDGQFLATANTDSNGVRRIVNLWELISGKECQTIQVSTGHEISVVKMAFGPDKRVLATSGQVETEDREDRYTIQLWDVVTGKQLLRFQGVDAETECLAFSPDGKLLASGHRGGDIFIWDVSSVSPFIPKGERHATSAELETWWADLANEDATKARAAVWGLVGAGPAAVELLRRRIHPATGAPTEQIKRLIAALDSKDFQEREQATQQLAEMEELAQPALKETLRSKPPPEQRRRTESLTASIFPVRSTDKRRQLRSIQVLERLGTKDAIQLLSSLAKGAPESLVTKHAEAALKRLRLRSKSL
jgi:WD40 repeat protein